MEASPTSTAPEPLCASCKTRPREITPLSSVYCQVCYDGFQRRQEAHRERATGRLVEDCPRLAGYHWRNCTIDDDNRDVVEKAGNWQFDEENEYNTLFLWGPVGTGKTLLAYLVAKQWIAAGWDETARLIVVRNLLAQARASFTNGVPNPVDALLAEDIGLLVLDDLGAERCTDWARDTIATIVENRYMATFQPIVVTTNYSPAQLAVRLSGGELIEGQRIVSRLLEGALVLKLDGPDRRIVREEDAA